MRYEFVAPKCPRNGDTYIQSRFAWRPKYIGQWVWFRHYFVVWKFVCNRCEELNQKKRVRHYCWERCGTEFLNGDWSAVAILPEMPLRVDSMMLDAMVETELLLEKGIEH